MSTRRKSSYTVPESQMPERVIAYLYAFLLLRLGLDKDVPYAELLETLRKFDYDEIKQAHRWLSQTMIERYDVKIGKLTVERDLGHRRTKAKKVLRQKGDATRDLVLKRYLLHRDKYRVPAKDIPAKVAADTGKTVGTIRNILRDWRKAARI